MKLKALNNELKETIPITHVNRSGNPYEKYHDMTATKNTVFNKIFLSAVGLMLVDIRDNKAKTTKEANNDFTKYVTSLLSNHNDFNKLSATQIKNLIVKLKDHFHEDLKSEETSPTTIKSGPFEVFA